MRVLCVLILCALVAGIHASAVNTQHEPISHHVTSRMFHSMNAQSELLASVSQPCYISTKTLYANTAVMAANASIIHAGCFNIELGNPAVCKSDFTTLTFNCDCQPIVSNTAWLYGNVTALGGKVCPVSMSVTLVASMVQKGRTFTLHENMKQTLQEFLVLGDKCTDQDIQTALEASVNEGVTDLDKLLGKGFTVRNYDFQVGACDFSARRTGPSSGPASTVVKPSA